jgi:hypothetical protein
VSSYPNTSRGDGGKHARASVKQETEAEIEGLHPACALVPKKETRRRTAGSFQKKTEPSPLPVLPPRVMLWSFFVPAMLAVTVAAVLT